MPPTLADAQGGIGIWTVQNDIDAATNAAVRKPSTRVNPRYEVVADTQAVTNRLVFGNLVARAFPEHITRATALALAAHARIAEQQLLTQDLGRSRRTFPVPPERAAT